MFYCRSDDVAPSVVRQSRDWNLINFGSQDCQFHTRRRQSRLRTAADDHLGRRKQQWGGKLWRFFDHLLTMTLATMGDWHQLLGSVVLLLFLSTQHDLAYLHYLFQWLFSDYFYLTVFTLNYILFTLWICEVDGSFTHDILIATKSNTSCVTVTELVNMF